MSPDSPPALPPRICLATRVTVTRGSRVVTCYSSKPFTQSLSSSHGGCSSVSPPFLNRHGEVQRLAHSHAASTGDLGSELRSRAFNPHLSGTLVLSHLPGQYRWRRHPQDHTGLWVTGLYHTALLGCAHLSAPPLPAVLSGGPHL